MNVNLRQLAKLLELSPTTISRALAGYSDVSSKTRRRVQDAAKRYNYHPNPVAQRLQKGKTETIGIALSASQNYFKDTFFLDLLAGISVSLSKVGYDLNISVAPNSEHEIDSLRRMVQGKRVDGIILTLTKAVDERISYLLDQNFPFVLYGRTEESRPHAFLDMDGELAFREACTFLIELGHKRIALINGEPEYMFPAFCSEGYRNGLKSGNLPFDPELVREWRHGDAQLSSFQQTLALMKLPQPPTAILFHTETAAGILQALKKINLKVGEEISLVGYDDLETYPSKSGKKEFYGFFFNVNVKSLVWYSPENFEAGGYSVPNTMEELIALSDQIVKDGGTPWCIGLGSGDATGWPATDWVEDLMLRTQPASVYDGWVTNDVKFNDPRVVAAIETFGKFAKNSKYVDGGMAAVGSTDFRDSPKGLFTVPPRCYMHRQASFIPAFFPKRVKVGEDADFFYFPSYSTKKLGNPVLGGGTLLAMAKDSKATREFIKYLQHPKSHEIWMARAGFLTPHKGVDLSKYSSGTLRKQGEILQNATTFRFDGSDLMPGAIGAGAFWSQMVYYVSGASAKKVADNVQSTWDSIK